jgi:hypothetical protein
LGMKICHLATLGWISILNLRRSEDR